MKKAVFILLLVSINCMAQPCEGNNGNNQGGGNSGNGYGNNPCNPVPMSALPLFGLVVVSALGYSYWKYKRTLEV